MLWSALGRTLRTVRRRLSQSYLRRILRLYQPFFLRYGATLRRQLQFKEHALNRGELKSGAKIFLPLVETSHYQFLQLLGLAKALEMRGARVLILVCDSELSGCEIKSVETSGRRDVCLECRFGRKRILPLFGFQTVNFRDLVSAPEMSRIALEAARIARDYPAAHVVGGVDIIPLVDDSVTRYYYGDVPQGDSHELAAVREAHLRTVLLSLASMDTVTGDFGPNAILSNMVVYSAWAPYYMVAKRLEIDYFSLYLTPWDYYSVRLNSPDLAISGERYRRYLESRDSRSLDPGEQTELSVFMTKRFEGSSRVFREYGWFTEGESVAVDQGVAVISEEISIDLTKRNVLLPTNLFWDKGLNRLHLLFGDVFEWCAFSIDAVRDHPEVQLYIKIHPAEKFYGKPNRTGVREVLLQRLGDIPPNVTFITPQQKLNTYELLPFMDVGVLLNGTLGIEMMLMGIPVIAVGHAPYRGIGLANEPGTLEEYRALLLGESKATLADKEASELFAYFYFIKTLIPWRLTKQAFKQALDNFEFASLEQLMPGSDHYLDHLCNCILDPENTSPESWVRR
jgi:hypothetical protein